MSTPTTPTEVVEAPPRLSMDELLASEEAGLPQVTHDLCFAGKLVGEYQNASARLFELESDIDRLEDRIARQARNSGSDEDAPVRRRMTAKSSTGGLQDKLDELKPQAQEAADEADAIRDRMLAHTKTVLLVAKEDHEWASFCEQNPPRDAEEDPNGYGRDLREGRLTCNIDTLAQKAGDWVTRYDDETSKPEHWAKALKVTAFGDRVVMASKIVGLQTQTVDLGKSRRDWLATRRGGSSSK